MKTRRTLVMTSIVMAMLVASMDATITNTTMPIIAEELGGFTLYAWSFAAYMIFATVLTPLAGRISDIYGRKTIFGFGILFFLFGSLLCGFADTMLQLVLFRAVQGMGAGIMMPFPIIIAGDLYPVEQRGKVQALFSAMWGLAAILAPMLGSFFVEVANWRWIFYINVPICLLSFVLLLGYKEEYEPKKSRIDVLGSILFATGVSLLLAATTVENQALWLAGSGTFVVALFYMYERKHPSPIVPISMFANRQLRWMIINSFVACAALFGTSSYIPLFLQERGYSVFISGVALLGMSIGWMASSVPAGRWVLRYGYSRLLLAGNLLVAVSGFLLLFLGPHTGFLYAFIALTVQGVGYGLVFTVSTIGSQQLVPQHQSGVSASLQMFSRNIGTAIGVTIMGALLVRSHDFMAGIHAVFVYGTLVSLLALATAWLIRDTSDTLTAKQMDLK
ncbi:MFS transporter [Paenibacillus abyssi]|uniref:MFS-type drug efflux transporter P55 n=1 Tax=Paenibacillus abyssi TaxID=1340531 RepID=A0A917CIM6_9BACL|nr:MFS transporter [Paenibacillus abyssi]GGF90151.1 MFS transporter [Paenibacillus abyssi]